MKASIILGTARDERFSKYVSDFVFEHLDKTDIDFELVDVNDYLMNKTIPHWENPSELAKIADQLEESDFFIMIAPEYNHGYPGELKIFIDGLGNVFAKKPVGICGVSSGQYGGVRMVEQLHNILIARQAVCIRNTVYFSYIEKITNNGKIIKNTEDYEENLDGMMEELLWYAEALKVARNKN